MSHLPKALNRRQVLAALAGAAAAATAAVPSARADAGPGQVREVDFDWVDAARSRPVPARLYRPARSGAAVPLVVFSHGIGGSRLGYRYLGHHWATQGIAALHLQHVGSDRSLWTRNPLDLMQRMRQAAQDREAIDRVHDLRFALDRLLSAEEGADVDHGRIVAAGHSYGANTVLLASGARVEREGRPMDLREPRLAAAIVLSAPPFYGEGPMQPILSPVTLPTLHITATEDVIRIPGYYSGVDDRLAVFDAVGGRRKALAVFEGGSHSVFTDWSGTGGVLRNPQVKAATQALTLAFLRDALDGDGSLLREWPRLHGPLLSRFVASA